MQLGRSGLRVSRIWLGMMSYGDPEWRSWVLDEDEAEPLIVRALELGINAFDTANIYSSGRSEELTGRLVLRHAARESVVIATKVYYPFGDQPNSGGLSRKAVIASVDASLRRLGTDYIDLLQIHRWDESTPIDETMQVLDDLVRVGKVRYLGASSMYAWQFAKAQHTAASRGLSSFISMQAHYNLVYREEEREMLPLCADQGVGVLAWSPLARGMLAAPWREDGSSIRLDEAAPYFYGVQDADVAVALEQLAARRQQPMSTVALAWVLGRQGVVAPVVGATAMHHLDEAVRGLEVELSDDEMRELDAPYVPHAVIGH